MTVFEVAQQSLAGHVLLKFLHTSVRHPFQANGFLEKKYTMALMQRDHIWGANLRRFAL